MAAKSTIFDNALLLLLFNGTALSLNNSSGANSAPIAQNATSAIASFTISLNTADPTLTAGSGTVNKQNASEVAYTGYARRQVARTTSGFTVSGNSCVLAAEVDFPAGTGSSGTVTYFTVGVGLSTTPGIASDILYYGPVTPNIVCGTGITPALGVGTTITET